MNTWKRPTAALSLIVAATAGTILATAGPAAASDTFSVYAGWDLCTEDTYYPSEGYLEFKDSGPGAPGGGDNDDYLLLGDWCPNGDGVKGWAWVDGTLKGEKYNGNGASSNPIVWDPFGNLVGKHAVGLKVCSVNGNAGTPYHCESGTKTIDG